ncbi:unnamed protein product [Polarella glacialis]|uniref:Uncharacterized protein n=1 Tax=Polarella glacialis TaxID=89957 RepID=A0A813GBF4_POLGL|nr:unnamed protein product [Polarella glacialis]
MVSTGTALFLLTLALPAADTADDCAGYLAPRKDAFAGVTLRPLFMVAENGPSCFSAFQSTAERFARCTGAVVDTSALSVGDCDSGSEKLRVEAVLDIGTSSSSGQQLYDLYVVKPTWISEQAEYGLLHDLSAYIRGDTALDFQHTFRSVRAWLSQYQYGLEGSLTIFMPFDLDLNALVVQRPELLRSGGHAVPETWDELASLAELYNDPDGTGRQYGVCGLCYGFRFSLLWTVLASYSQTKGTSEGFYFDAATMEPLLGGETFRLASEIWLRLMKAGPGDCMETLGPPPSWQNRCVFLVEVPLLAGHGSGAFEVHKPPGSTRVRATAKGAVADCDDELCPHASMGVNRATYYPTGGWGIAVRSGLDAATAEAATSLAATMHHESQWWTDYMIEPIRRKDVNLDAFARPENGGGWTNGTFAAFQDAFWFSAEDDRNMAMDLRIARSGEYMSAADEAVRMVIKGKLPLEQLGGEITQKWNTLTAGVGYLKQSRIYRNSLHLPPLTKVQLCATFRVEMDAEDPARCKEADVDQASLVIVIAVLGSLMGVAMLFSAARAAYYSYRRAQQHRKRRELDMKLRIEDAIQTTKTLNFPMNLVRGPDFVGAGKMVQHETLRGQGKLLVIDWLHEAYSVATERPIVFFSHQWTAFGEPDHTNKQFEMMCTSLRTICEKQDWNLEAVLVWADFSSIPQVHRGLQGLAIRSLPAYAKAASAFVVVAPTVPHNDLPGQLCDEDTYRRRVWCRAEQLCHSLRNGTRDMWVANDTACLPMEKNWFDDHARFVFNGEATCCRLQHKGQLLCDREALVLPILGLFGELYAGKNIPGERQRLWDDVKGHQGKMFPEAFTFTFCSEKGGNNGKEGTTTSETRVLFGELMGKMEELIDTDAAVREQLVGSSTQGVTGRDSVTPVHGAAVLGAQAELC